jgi:PAS domain-containing protein
MNDQAFRVVELFVTALLGGGAVAIGRFLLSFLKEKNSLDIQRDSANLDRLDRQGKIDRLNADYIITHFEKILADKDREHAADYEQWHRDKINILTELRRTRDAYQVNLATLEGMRIRLADRDRQVSELRGGVHPLLAAPDRTDSVIITDVDGYIYYINQNVTLLTKWSDVDIMEKSICVLFPDDTFPPGRSALDWLRPEGGRDKLIKARLRQNDGTLIPVEMLISVFNIKNVYVCRFQIRQVFDPTQVDLSLDIYVPPSPESAQYSKALHNEVKKEAARGVISPRTEPPGISGTGPGTAGSPGAG